MSVYIESFPVPPRVCLTKQASETIYLGTYRALPFRHVIPRAPFSARYFLGDQV